jgi:RNA polymerase sigma-70 factor (ECF subfamily)
MALPVVRPATDDDLVERAIDGDVDSFSELVRRHRDGWFTLALRLLGDREVAADVTQETAIRAWTSMGSFRHESKFTTWTHRIVVNTSWTQRRRTKRHATTSIEFVDDPTHDPLEFHAERLGIREEVSIALWSLSAANRAVVVLKDVYGWSHTEVAEALDITVTAAKVRLHRGRTAMRHELEGVL